MSITNLVSNLEKAGWKDFASGEFLGTDFDLIGKTKVSGNRWFALLKSVPVLDAAALETWNETYQHFCKKGRGGVFAAGKYFVLVLLVDTIGKDALALLADQKSLGFLEMPLDITRGGGYTLLLIKDRKQLFMPKEVRLSKYLRATNFAKNTHQAVDAYKNSLTGGGKVAYVVLWTKEQLPNDKVMPTIGSGFKEFASENDEFRTLFEQAVAARSDIHATNQVLVPEFMRSPEAMMSQFYGFLKEKGVSELPSLNDDVYEIEFKDSAGDEALAWCYFK